MGYAWNFPWILGALLAEPNKFLESFSTLFS